MTALWDEPAERALAACAAVSRHGAELAASRLRPDDFHDQRCWQVIAAGLRISDDLGYEDRIRAVAAAANLWPADLETWVIEAPLQWDTNGGLAARVKAGADHRRRIAALLDELNQLGVTVAIVNEEQAA